MPKKDKTNLGELAEFFPAGKTTARATRVPAMRPGETLAQATAREDATTARIRAQQALRTMPTPDLVALVSRLYDAKEDYKTEYAELVRRVGQDEAERLVDAA